MLYCSVYCRSQSVPGCGVYRAMSGHRGGCHPLYRCYTVVYIVDHNRYLAVVCTEGCQDIEESVILGIDVIL